MLFAALDPLDFAVIAVIVMGAASGLRIYRKPSENARLWWICC
jgi:hypothetical protein